MTQNNNDADTDTPMTEANNQPSFTIKKPKKEVDFSKEVDEQIEKSRSLLQEGGKTKLKDALEGLMVWEKKTRLGEDFESTGRVVVEIVKLCGEYQEWSSLNEYITLIAKKRSQSKQAITKMVQAAMELIEQTPSKEVKTDLINTLRKVTDGKIYVEVERARLVRTLAKMKEEDGAVAEAAKLMQDVQIETVGSMEAKEKIDFILEQMRLTLDAHDYVRALIISRKITARSLLDEEHQDLKIRYYNLLIRYYTEKKDYLEICKAHQSIYDTPKVKENTALWVDQLQHIALFIILAKYDNQQSDIIHKVKLDKNFDEPPMALFKALLKQFTSTQIINWPEFQQVFASALSQHPVFSGAHKERLDDLHNRVIERNLRIIAKYYTRIHLNRLAQLLYLEDAKTEKFVSDMVTSKTILAKLDRIDGVIEFKQVASSEDNEVMNDWAHDIQDLLQLVEKTNHLINKDYMIHQAKKKK